MKKKILLVFILAVGMIFTACKKDEEETGGNGGGDPNPTPQPGTMTLKVDGAAWTADLAVVATKTEQKGNYLITVTGSDNNAHQCQVAVHNVSGPGTYQLGGNMTNQNLGRWTEGHRVTREGPCRCPPEWPSSRDRYGHPGHWCAARKPRRQESGSRIGTSRHHCHQRVSANLRSKHLCHR